MNRIRFSRLLLALAILLTFVAGTVTGCTPCINGYKQLVVDQGIARFSLEYPCKWKVLAFETRQDYTAFSVDAPRLQRGETDATSTSWSFLASPPEVGVLNAEAALNDSISFWENKLDFKLLERSTVEVGGVTAERVVYFYRYRVVDPRTRLFTEETEPVVVTEIYFDYDGLIWGIDADSNLEVAEAHKVHWEHMLETFRILD